MKTLKLISIVVILSLASCRSGEMSFGRSKTSEIGKEKIKLDVSHSELENDVRFVETRDSSKQFVGMRIYPLDTFSFSMDKGFRGQASVIEYWVQAEVVKRAKDSSRVVKRTEYTSGYVDEVEIKKNKFSKGREVRKEFTGILRWIAIVGFGTFSIWLWRGMKKETIFRKGFWI